MVSYVSVVLVAYVLVVYTKFKKIDHFMHTKIFSATTIGIHAHQVDVEVDISFGLVNFFIVGLPDTAIKESRQRIVTALKNSGFKVPEKKITVNLAPAHIKKEGTLFDLPIALGILYASKMIDIDPKFLEETIIIGELSLDGTIKPIKGALSIACDASKLGKKRIILPHDNAYEDVEVFGVKSLVELVHFLRGETKITATKTDIKNYIASQNFEKIDFSDVRGQSWAKRALQIAAAGRHNILFSGPPGSGKTMLAKRLLTILPEMTFQEIIDTTKIYSISGKLGTKSLIVQRPFRSPHHSVSLPGLIGGGSFPKPGEASMAHHGVLFLDELTEFKRDVLEALRQPLESKVAEISRVQQSIQYPAAFLLVAALNPCPCGYFGDTTKACICSSAQIQKYQSKLSGPLLDRIDIKVSVQAVSYQDATDTKAPDKISSLKLLEGISFALKKQIERFGSIYKTNSMMSAQEVEQFCKVDTEGQKLLEQAFSKLNLSMRRYHKILKLARTIADIEDSQNIQSKHIQEAIMYKS